MLAGAYVTRQHCDQGWRVGTRRKDSHLCWHKIAGGCCVRQHKGVLAASKNRFWPSSSNRHGLERLVGVHDGLRTSTTTGPNHHGPLRLGLTTVTHG
jgi:hypothetical protein